MYKIIKESSKPFIIAIVGASGSGKTTLSLLLQEKLGIRAISSYTTRPMREGEVDGVDHIFVTKDEIPPKEQMLAHTVYGGYDYWTTFQQFEQEFITTYVVDEKGLEDIMFNAGGKFHVISVSVKRADNPTEGERMARDKGRAFFSDDCFDVVIHNNGTIKDLFEQADYKIGKIMKQYGSN